MARAAHPDTMKPHGPARTRTAPPVMPDQFPFAGRYRAYILFGACSIAFVVSGLILLRIVWSLGSGPAAWQQILSDLGHPAYLAYHVVALVAFLFTGYRFFLKLFGKAQPPRIGPLPSPPPAAFPPLFLGLFAVASAAVLVVAFGVWP